MRAIGRTFTVIPGSSISRFIHTAVSFRVDYCGRECPAGSNLANPDGPPTGRNGYVAGRPLVWIDTGEVFMLDLMVDDFGALKADRELRPETIQYNPLRQHLETIQQSQAKTQVVVPNEVEGFYEQIQTICTSEYYR